jgi:hypothetical protein
MRLHHKTEKKNPQKKKKKKKALFLKENFLCEGKVKNQFETFGFTKNGEIK